MTYKFTPCKESNYGKGRSGVRIKFIVIHYTANNGDTAQNNADYFAKATVEASAHFFVDENEAVRSVPDGDTAWHCGAAVYVHPECRNANSLGIEICSRRDADGVYYFKDEAVSRAAELTRELMREYKIPVENVIRHYDVTGKLCPAPMVNDENKWLSFKAMLKSYGDATEKDAEISKNISDEVNDFVWELGVRGIISNKALWLARAEEDENIYHLLRKTVGFLKQMNV